MRADLYLVAQGLAKSRTLAQKLIASGSVTLDGKPVKRPSEEISEGEHTVLVAPIDEMRYVSRGGLKLEAALDAFSVSVEGLTVADVGASTGGFTHCLVTRGAARVYAVDSGHGQLDPSLLAHPSVRSMEGVNARYLTPADFLAYAPEVGALWEGLSPAERVGFGVVDGAVMDVSFISQTLIHPALARIVREGGFLLTLIKPQFEVGTAGLGKHGVVKSQHYRNLAVERVTASAEANGFALQGIIPSPITGGDGNAEYIGYFLKKSGK